MHAFCDTGSLPAGSYLVLLLLVSADPEPTAYDIQKALPGHGLETPGAGTRDALRAAFVAVISRLHWARGVKTCPDRKSTRLNSSHPL
jgi:hypothetical protein